MVTTEQQPASPQDTENTSKAMRSPAKQYPPGPPGRFSALRLLNPNNNFVQYLEHLSKEYGDVTCLRIGPQRVYIISHPDYVRDMLANKNQKFRKGYIFGKMRILLGNGLITSEGSFHHRQRRMMQPAFHRNQIEASDQRINRFAIDFCSRWTAGSEIDVSEEMMELALESLARALFKTGMEEHVKSITEAMTDASDAYARWGWMPFGRVLMKMPLPGINQFRKSKAHLDAIIYEMIDDARKTPIQDGNLLSQIVHARDDQRQGAQMNDLELRDELVTLLMAGHETSANALTWTWYFLSQNPEVEARLHREIDTVLEGRQVTVADLPKLSYAYWVLAESMRLRPPVYALGRRATEPVEIGGYQIARRNNVLASQYVIHRDPRFWPNPEKFDPERWSPENVKQHTRFAYFPFGGGPRQCIGEGLFWLEGQLLLITLAQRWRLRLPPNHQVDFSPSITLRPKGGMKMKLEARALGSAESTERARQ